MIYAIKKIYHDSELVQKFILLLFYMSEIFYFVMYQFPAGYREWILHEC